MISDLLTIFILGCFGFFGLTRPHLAMCGLIWVNLYRPQESSFSFLGGAQISLYFTLYVFVVFVINANKIKPPKSALYHFLCIGLMIWLTIANVFAQFPEVAALKYDSVIKSLLVTYLIPFVIYDREKLEQFLWVVFISFGTLAFFGGVKALLGGGGYGMNLIGVRSTLWSEGSIYTNQMLSTIPIGIYLAKHSILGKEKKLFKVLAYGYVVCALFTLVGTQARSGMICLLILGGFLFITSKKKVKFLIMSLIVPLILFPFIPDSWYDRMSTLTGGSESIKSEGSAMGRVLVWRWGVGYVLENPVFGGGFHSYLANAGQLQQFIKDGEAEVTARTKAFHNILFEVAASSGLVGLGLFLGMLNFIFFRSRKISKSHPPDSWAGVLAKALYVSMLVYCSGGMFVSYAFYPYLYILFGSVVILEICVQNGSTKINSELAAHNTAINHKLV
jgi:probable O-glycosylation ligase (exosortase A-associated)